MEMPASPRRLELAAVRRDRLSGYGGRCHCRISHRTQQKRREVKQVAETTDTILCTTDPRAQSVAPICSVGAAVDLLQLGFFRNVVNRIKTIIIKLKRKRLR
jgi:hypothetical protein